MIERQREVVEQLEKAATGEISLESHDVQNLIESLDFTPGWDPDDYSYMAVLLDSLGMYAHAETLLQQADDQNAREGSPGITASLRNVRGMLSASHGNFARAIELFEDALSVADNGTPLHIKILVNLATANLYVGRIVRAADLAQRAKGFPVQARSPAVDTLLATVQTGIAQSKDNLSDLRAASSDLRRASRSRVTELDDDHPSALTAVANMATIEFNLACAENSVDARQRAIGVLDVATRRLAAELGSDHPQTLTCRVNLVLAELEIAIIDKSPARLETALSNLEIVSLRSSSVLGANHSITRLAAETMNSPKLARFQAAITTPLLKRTPALAIISGPGPGAVGASAPLSGTTEADQTDAPRLKRRPRRKPTGNAPVVVPEPDKPDPAHVLTWRQRKVLQVIRESVQKRGYPPSMREIGDAVGLTSTSSVSYQLSTLQKKGYLHRDVGRPRTVEVRLPGHPAVRPEPGHEDEAGDIPGIDIPSQEAIYVPLVGRIAAGGPILAEQSVEDVFPLPRQLVGEGTLFLLKVAGDSMRDAAIADGDWVVVREQPIAENGEIVAFMLNGEATVKTLKQSSDGHIWLMAHNQAYTPILGDDASILGKVVAVLRRV